ncbi:MAG: penicillin-binding transpeptidase domain-containing protein [Oscillospiraceae bacterium]
MNTIKKDRLIILTAVFAILLVVYLVFLYKLQIIEGEAYYKESRNQQVTTSTVVAARGNILDRYGRVIVSNKSSYDLTINESELFPSDDSVDSNATILKLVKLIREYGEDYIDELPITTEPPFEYTEISDTDKARLQAYMKTNKVDENATAVELLSSMRTRYKIDSNYSAEEARIIAGIRYAVNVRYLINTSDYVLVQDADMKLISIIRENNILGVNVKESFIRGYNTTYAAHILGYVGLMNDAEYEKYAELGYSGDAKVGKSGVEYAFEKYLHGTNGTVQVTSAADGTIISKTYTTEPKPGNNVYLTIDIALQEATERALAATVNTLRAERGYDISEDLLGDDDKKDEEATPTPTPTPSQTPDGQDDEEKIDDEITGAGAVVVDVKTGEPLAIASWPTYNTSTMLENYSKLLTAKYSPLFNRALQGTYAPGSTFKPCTAIAGLTEKTISTSTRIQCTGVYTKYAAQGYAPQCWIYASHLTHGSDNVTEALRDSCNIFFYTVGNNLGIDKLEKYARQFGLGESTGIEIYEETGNMSNRANHYEYAGTEWVVGDTLQAAIGQADSIFTPLQLAEYCAAIANNGQRHSASILKEARSYDYSEKIVQRTEEVLSTVKTEDYNWDAVHKGMELVAKHPDGSAYATFYNYGASTVACKTGTAQKGENITNDGIFICFAPVEDPEIAIAVVIERGQSGSRCAPVARSILETYFSIKSASDVTETEGSLLK